MYADPTSPAVGGGYYILDRLADPREVVTVIECSPHVVVRDSRGVEYPVPRHLLSRRPADEVYRELRRAAPARPGVHPADAPVG
jgi:hypothetical protein